MNTQLKKVIKISVVMFSLAGIVTAMGFGCGMGFQPMGDPSQNGFIFGSQDPQPDLVIIPDTKTVGITNFTSVLDAMTSITNVPPSNNTRTAFNNKLASFGETKSALQINAPMLLAYMAVGSEVCNDLINNEQGQQAANRRFFVGANVNLANNNNNATAITEEVIDGWIRRLARQAWGRNETAEELAMLRAGIKEIREARPANTQGLSRQIALSTCTAVLASTSAYEI